MIDSTKIISTKSDQRKFDELFDTLENYPVFAPNESQRKLFERDPNAFVSERVGRTFQRMNNFKVKVNFIKYQENKNSVQILTSFQDEKVEFFSTAIFKNNDEMYNDATYNFIRNLKEGSDTTLSFMFLEQALARKNQPYLLVVVPMPVKGVKYIIEGKNDSHFVDMSHWIYPNKFQ